MRRSVRRSKKRRGRVATEIESMENYGHPAGVGAGRVSAPNAMDTGSLDGVGHLTSRTHDDDDDGDRGVSTARRVEPSLRPDRDELISLGLGVSESEISSAAPPSLATPWFYTLRRLGTEQRGLPAAAATTLHLLATERHTLLERAPSADAGTDEPDRQLLLEWRPLLACGDVPLFGVWTVRLFDLARRQATQYVLQHDLCAALYGPNFSPQNFNKHFARARAELPALLPTVVLRAGLCVPFVPATGAADDELPSVHVTRSQLSLVVAALVLQRRALAALAGSVPSSRAAKVAIVPVSSALAFAERFGDHGLHVATAVAHLGAAATVDRVAVLPTADLEPWLVPRKAAAVLESRRVAALAVQEECSALKECRERRHTEAAKTKFDHVRGGSASGLSSEALEAGGGDDSDGGSVASFVEASPRRDAWWDAAVTADAEAAASAALDTATVGTVSSKRLASRLPARIPLRLPRRQLTRGLSTFLDAFRRFRTEIFNERRASRHVRDATADANVDDVLAFLGWHRRAWNLTHDEAEAWPCSTELLRSPELLPQVRAFMRWMMAVRRVKYATLGRYCISLRLALSALSTLDVALEDGPRAALRDVAVCVGALASQSLGEARIFRRFDLAPPPDAIPWTECASIRASTRAALDATATRQTALDHLLMLFLTTVPPDRVSVLRTLQFGVTLIRGGGAGGVPSWEMRHVAPDAFKNATTWGADHRALPPGLSAAVTEFVLRHNTPSPSSFLFGKTSSSARRKAHEDGGTALHGTAPCMSSAEFTAFVKAVTHAHSGSVTGGPVAIRPSTFRIMFETWSHGPESGLDAAARAGASAAERHTPATAHRDYVRGRRAAIESALRVVEQATAAQDSGDTAAPSSAAPVATGPAVAPDSLAQVTAAEVALGGGVAAAASESDVGAAAAASESDVGAAAATSESDERPGAASQESVSVTPVGGFVAFGVEHTGESAMDVQLGRVTAIDPSASTLRVVCYGVQPAAAAAGRFQAVWYVLGDDDGADVTREAPRDDVVCHSVETRPGRSRSVRITASGLRRLRAEIARTQWLS